MAERKFVLDHPPIVEAVLDIECDLPPGWQITTMEAPARERFRDRYPTFRTQFIQQLRIEAKPDDLKVSPQDNKVQALQFLQNDKIQLVQIRTEGFAFNRLAPYTSLDDYLPEIERTWRVYLGLTKPVKIRTIRLRYINRIPIPLEGGRFDLEQYFKVGPRLPDEEKLAFIGFLNQHAAMEVKTGNLVNLVLTAQKQEGNTLPVIFDNSVEAPEPGDPEDWSWILDKIQILRELKNRIFLSTLTESCLDSFRKP